MLLRWFPWKGLVSRLARSRGLVDPVEVLSRLESFAQPLDVKEPIELLRSGLVFHARGVLNTGAIQHNLDWIWPYWVERQYDPLGQSFIPRAFSITHVNLSNRNWTAIGLPDVDAFPIVDPRGLVTPHWDGWSLDAWIVPDEGEWLVPSKLTSVVQSLDLTSGLCVTTHSSNDGLDLRSRADVVDGEDGLACRVRYRASADRAARLVVSVRPYNPEGVSFIHEIILDEISRSLVMDGRHLLHLRPTPDRFHLAYYREGDVKSKLGEAERRSRVTCRVGMASAAGVYRIAPRFTIDVTASVPISDSHGGNARRTDSWSSAIASAAPAIFPDPLFQRLWDAAVRSVILMSPGEVYPGPYTYKRFWFRDSAFILHALLCLGLHDRAARVLRTFPRRQTSSGFFLSQEGEWDSNGEALWILRRYFELSGRPPVTEWIPSIVTGADWIARKRTRDEGATLHRGLLPAGFSAEHLGPNDFYFWDDFWGVAGLRAAAWLLREAGHPGADRYDEEASRFLSVIERCLGHVSHRLRTPAMPASPYRRLDSGAIGSLAAGYPTQIFAGTDERLLATAKYLASNCLVKGGFYQDIIHSGINPYLTLHLAQVLMRAGSAKAFDLVRTVAHLATPTGQWPEAIDPRTGAGCMGDGHHVWAAAEWILMLRNMVVREEGNTLVIGEGFMPEWLELGRPLHLGPVPTTFGPVEVTIHPRAGHVDVEWKPAFRREPDVVIAIPGLGRVTAPAGSASIRLAREEVPLCTS